jgi:hypothetical protein
MIWRCTVALGAGGERLRLDIVVVVRCVDGEDIFLR